VTQASRCRTLLVSAPASGQGKTTVTAALARRARQEGLRVRVFKTGPDFIDPMLLARASGAPVYQLDLWMVGEAGCQRLLHEAACDVDLILIEGVMGLFDGDPSSADLARRFDVPILAVIDGSAMAHTFGALALGLSQYQPDLPFHGVIANRIGSPRHAEMLEKSLRPPLHWLGALPHSAEVALPERHLGLVQADELADVDTRIDAAAAALGDAVNFSAIPLSAFDGTDAAPIPPLLAGRRIAIARDAAHAFCYAANRDTLRALGAELVDFSPLNDRALPDCDAVYLTGGYPELHAAQLAANNALHDALRAHHAAGKPMLAECGGMMGLFDTLVTNDGDAHRMVGLLPGGVRMQPGFQALGMQAIDTPDGDLRGHSFHYSKCETPLEPTTRGRNPNGGSTAEAVYQVGSLTASYIHSYFASNPVATAHLFRP
jgi:cobyrinic acid a,c-diamide synthase